MTVMIGLLIFVGSGLLASLYWIYSLGKAVYHIQQQIVLFGKGLQALKIWMRHVETLLSQVYLDGETPDKSKDSK